MINDLLPFLGFVEHHPVGSIVQAVVESYSSHGAYVTIGDVRAYIPLRFMADPPPRSAREAMKLHDEVSLVVVGFHAQRRGIDLAAPELAASITGMTRRRGRRLGDTDEADPEVHEGHGRGSAVTAAAAGAADGEPPEKPVKAATARKRAAKTPIDEGGTPARRCARCSRAAVPQEGGEADAIGSSQEGGRHRSVGDANRRRPHVAPATEPDVPAEPAAAPAVSSSGHQGGRRRHTDADSGSDAGFDLDAGSGSGCAVEAVWSGAGQAGRGHDQTGAGPIEQGHRGCRRAPSSAPAAVPAGQADHPVALEEGGGTGLIGVIPTPAVYGRRCAPRHVERQLTEGPAPAGGGVVGRDPARHPVHAGDEAGRRRLSGADVQRPRLRDGAQRSGPMERRCDPVEGRAVRRRDELRGR